MRKQDPYRYDEKVYADWLLKRALPLHSNVVWTIKYRGVKLISLSEAIQQKRKIMLHINVGAIRPGNERLETRDIRKVINLFLDGEYPENPELAIAVGKLLLARLVQRGIAKEGQDLEISGAGFHIILGIEPIFCRDGDQADKVNDAWLLILEYVIDPLFKECCEEVGVKMKLDHCGIAQLCAPEGTWRYSNPKKNDHPSLKQGFFRTSILGDDLRHESEVLRAMILEYVNHPPRTAEQISGSQLKRSGLTVTDLAYEKYYEDLVRWDANKHVREAIYQKLGRYSTSDEFVTYLFHLAGCFGKDVALDCARLCRDFSNVNFDDEKAESEARLSLHRGFHVPKNHTDYTIILKPTPKEYTVRIDAIQESAFHQWSDESIVLDNCAFVSVDAARYHYRQWCQINEVKIIGDKQFAVYMKRKFQMEVKVKTIHGKKQKCYMGIAIPTTFSKTDAEWITMMTQRVEIIEIEGE